MSEAYLVHYGIKGQKWYERRFQNPDGSLTVAGRIRYGVGQAVKKVSSGARIVVNKSKQKYKTVQEEHKEKQEQKAEEDKQSIIRSANAKRILDYQDKLTTQELNDALNRVRSVTALNDQAAKDKKAAEDATNYNKKSHKIGRKIAKLADFSLSAVNTVQKFVDAGKKFSKWFDDDDNDDFLKISTEEAYEKAKKMSPKKLGEFNTYLNTLNNIKKISEGKTGDDQGRTDFTGIDLSNAVEEARKMNIKDANNFSKYLSSLSVIAKQSPFATEVAEAEKRGAEKVKSMIDDRDDWSF